MVLVAGLRRRAGEVELRCAGPDVSGCLRGVARRELRVSAAGCCCVRWPGCGSAGQASACAAGCVPRRGSVVVAARRKRWWWRREWLCCVGLMSDGNGGTIGCVGRPVPAGSMISSAPVRRLCGLRGLPRRRGWRMAVQVVCSWRRDVRVACLLWFWRLAGHDSTTGDGIPPLCNPLKQ